MIDFELFVSCLIWFCVGVLVVTLLNFLFALKSQKQQERERKRWISESLAEISKMEAELHEISMRRRREFLDAAEKRQAEIKAELEEDAKWTLSHS